MVDLLKKRYEYRRFVLPDLIFQVKDLDVVYCLAKLCNNFFSSDGVLPRGFALPHVNRPLLKYNLLI